MVPAIAYVLRTFLLLATLVACSSATPAWAQSGMLTIQIRVQDQTGAPLPFAKITISAADGNLISHYVADAQGEYSLTGPTNNNIAPFAFCGADSTDSYRACDFIPSLPLSGTYSVVITVEIPPAPIPAQQPPRGWIDGTVTLATTHAPVPGVRVALAATPLVTTTAADGTYQFAALSTTDGQGGGPSYTVVVTPPAGYVAVGTASQPVTVQAGQGVGANFVLAPAFVPFWVESFVPVVTDWSGPDARAVAFGARPQWTHFLVVAPQQGPRLEVFDPVTKGYAWVDAADVGPSGPPASR